MWVIFILTKDDCFISAHGLDDTVFENCSTRLYCLVTNPGACVCLFYHAQGCYLATCVARLILSPFGLFMGLPLLIFPCTIKSRSSLQAPAHPVDPRKRAVKRLYVSVCYEFDAQTAALLHIIGFPVTGK